MYDTRKRSSSVNASVKNCMMLCLAFDSAHLEDVTCCVVIILSRFRLFAHGRSGWVVDS